MGTCASAMKDLLGRIVKEMTHANQIRVITQGHACKHIQAEGITVFVNQDGEDISVIVRIFALHEILAYMAGRVSTRWKPSSAIVHHDTRGTTVQLTSVIAAMSKQFVLTGLANANKALLAMASLV